MSRRKNRNQERGQSQSAAPIVADAVPNNSAPEGRRDERQSNRTAPGRLAAALLVAGLWILALAVLAAFTANPVTINAQQILRSDYVVTAPFPAPLAEKLVSEKEWKRGGGLGSLRVENLSEIPATPGRRYIIPLKHSTGGAYRVTSAPLPDNPPLIYPATPEAERQLRDLLSH